MTDNAVFATKRFKRVQRPVGGGRVAVPVVDDRTAQQNFQPPSSWGEPERAISPLRPSLGRTRATRRSTWYPLLVIECLRQRGSVRAQERHQELQRANKLHFQKP